LTICRFSWPGWVRFGLTALLVVLGLSSCYLPDNFHAEIRIARDGTYDLSYEGDLIYAPLYAEINKGELKPDEVRLRTQGVINDLKRETEFHEVTDKGRARFGVKYDRTGKMDLVQFVAFVRHNARIITLKGNEDGTMTVNGANIAPSEAQKLMEYGISLKGEMRIVTDATVLEQNASEVRTMGRYNVYIWRIENSLSPAPHFKMARDIIVAPNSKEKKAK